MLQGQLKRLIAMAGGQAGGTHRQGGVLCLQSSHPHLVQQRLAGVVRHEALRVAAVRKRQARRTAPERQDAPHHALGTEVIAPVALRQNSHGQCFETPGKQIIRAYCLTRLFRCNFNF
eukprot:scpid110157/ scgid29415/ 